MNTTKSLEEIIIYIKNWMCEHDPSILYKWIEILSIHPSNQKYQTRFEFLLAILTTIKYEEFKKKNLDYGKLCEFISKFKQDTDSLFIEDYYPFSQLKLIPYFFKRKKYYFFYGQTERTYELLRILEKIYIFKTNVNYPELKLIKKLFIQVLKYQTKILKTLVQIKESNKRNESGIYFPTIRYFKSFEKLIMIRNEEIIDSRFILKIGAIERDLVNNFNKILNGDFFSDIYLKLSDSEFTLISPPIQIEILFKIFEEIVKGSDHYKTIKRLIKINLKNTLKDLFRYFFNSMNLIEVILNIKGESISNEVDHVILYENNLILLKVADLFSNTSLTSRLTYCNEILDQTVQIIEKEPKILLKLFGSYVYEIQVEEIRILKVILYESINLSPKSIMFSFETSIQMSVFSIIDLISIFEFSSSPLSFLKFLEEKYSAGRVFTLDQINIFAAFYINNESLPAYGEGMIMLDPHMWSDFYNNHLFNKYQDSIYELIEREFPNKFNKVNKWIDNQDLYECVDTRNLDSANIIKLEDKLIWIINPVFQPPLILEDFEFAMRVIGPLYADYIQRIIIQFEKLKKTYTSTNRYAIFLVPTKICRENPFYDQFEDDFSKVNEENPIIVKSFLNRQFKLISNIFYDYKLWGEKFLDSTNNDNCRYAIKQLAYSIIEYFEPYLSEEEIYNKTYEFIENNIVDDERDYFLDSIPTRNLEIKAYPPYLKWNPTDQEKVSKEVESYLRENQFEQRHLTSEESKDLYNEIYKVFYEKFKDLLSQFDVSLLYYAYKQLELIEGKRYLLRLEAGMRSSSQINEEYQDYFEKNYDEISKLSSTQRFILENVLKFGIKGNKKINSTDYGYIQAISFYLISISQFSDFSYSKLVEFTVNIKDFYKFDEVRSTSIFDYDAFKKVEFKNRLEATRDFYISQKTPSQIEFSNVNASEKEKMMVKNLEKAFQFQFSFTFTNMMRVISILSLISYNRKNISMFPLILISTEDLIKLVQEEYKMQYKNRPTFIGIIHNEIEEREIRAILEYLSLDFRSYEDEEILFQLRLMKKKNRLTLCPLLRLNGQILFGKECCNVAFQLWRKNTFAGVFPYKIPVDSKISLALHEIHSYQDKVFEDECGEIAKNALGKDKYIIRLKNFLRISSKLPKYPECGEIDLIAVNSNTRTCFILDAKNYFLKLNPFDIKNEINRFVKNKKSDLKKLDKKEQFVNAHFDLFLKFFQINERENWKFKKGFIIKYNFPSAYIPNLSSDFIFQSELETYLKN